MFFPDMLRFLTDNPAERVLIQEFSTQPKQRARIQKGLYQNNLEIAKKMKLLSQFFSWPEYTHQWVLMKCFKGHKGTGNDRKILLVPLFFIIALSKFSLTKPINDYI